MTDPATLSDAEVAELLGAYALDACEPEEAEAIEAVLARRPDLAREADRLSRAAAWIGATEAIEPPTGHAGRRARGGDRPPAVRRPIPWSTSTCRSPSAWTT